MTVSDHEVRSGRSPSQGNGSWTTTPRGTYGAESLVGRGAAVDGVAGVAEQRRVQRAGRRRPPGRRGRAAAWPGCSRRPRERVVGAVHPVAVALARADAGQAAVPDLVGRLLERAAGARCRRRRTGRGRRPAAPADHSAKLVPVPSQCAPSGAGGAGQDLDRSRRSSDASTASCQRPAASGAQGRRAGLVGWGRVELSRRPRRRWRSSG